jgi:hypothetical protein
MPKPFSGQYLATVENSVGQSGYLIINVDPDKNGVGVAYLSGAGGFSVLECTAHVGEQGEISGRAKRLEHLERIHDPNRQLSDADKREYEFKIQTNTNPHKFIAQDGENVHEMSLSPITIPNRVEATYIETWSEFKQWARSVKAQDRDSIFRGMPRASYDLNTSFHRTGRVDLERYRDFDHPTFVDIAETIGGLKFDKDADGAGASLGFAQHHGYPTPLLDWTESPYIAAYFAFVERLENNDSGDADPVRIYHLNGNFVNTNRPFVIQMADVYPRVWIFRPKSKGNQRLVYQQGIFLHSNIVGIEPYLLYLSRKHKIETIRAIEMPAAMAREAIEELSYMGVNHLSLFPGLDGAAKFAAIRQFYRG